MSRRSQLLGVAALVIAIGVAPVAARAELAVVRMTPGARVLQAAVDSEIAIEFDRPVARSSVTETSFWAFGRWSGAADGRFRFEDGDRTVILVPARRFSAGEQVMVVLSRDLQAMDGSFLRDDGYSYQFWTRAGRAELTFTEKDRFSTRTSPEVTTRAYGGFGSDLDGDGLLDLTIVNEDTNDLRTFMNLGKRRGLSHRYMEPPVRVGNVPSPSEPSDFDRDGDVDVVIANTQGSSISILLGNGDGTFGSAQTLGVGGEPRGVTLLDVEGDGDMDAATSVFVDGQITLLVNDGNGRFSVGPSFGTRGGERAIAAGDMNGDGRLDLVVGTRTTEEIHVYLNQGAGLFTLSSRRSSGGATWMLVLGDLDGDRSEDVAVVNSMSDNGAVLFGNGRGGLTPPRRRATDPFPLATDLADLDGDGDLDWVTSSFFGDWLLFENRGDGSFSPAGRFDAPQAASCSLQMDLDNDGSLELVLIDELEDEIIIMVSASAGFDSDFESGDTGGWSRTRGRLTVVTPGLGGTDRALSVEIDGSGTKSFVESRHPANEVRWQAEFRLRVDEPDLGGRSLEIVRLAGSRTQAKLHLEETGTGYQVRLFARGAFGLQDVGVVAVPDGREVRLALAWASASSSSAGDGSVVLTKNGKTALEVTDLSNFSAVVKKVRLGLPTGSRGAGGGALLFDEYQSGR